MNTASAALASALDADSPAAIAAALTKRPPYERTPAGEVLRPLWADVPVTTPWGEVTAMIWAADLADPEPSTERYLCQLTVPAGGSFVVNGKDYAPPAGGYVTGFAITIMRRTRYDGKLTVTDVTGGAFDSLTNAARDKIADWWDAVGQAAVLTPARLAARRLYDDAITAQRAAEAVEQARAALIIAEADKRHAANALRAAVTAFEGVEL